MKKNMKMYKKLPISKIKSPVKEQLKMIYLEFV